jgi:FHS family L-fucose permease-like MFS transporter
MAAPIIQQASTGMETDASKSYSTALSSLMILFFMMGFITVLNDILIPYLKLIFQLNYTEVMLINTCFFGAYFVMSIPSGNIVQKIGYKKGMLMGFLIASLGCFLFYPAAAERSYSLFLMALFILASGITMLQVSGNPYVAILGPSRTASSRLTLTQAFNSLATFVGPYIGTHFILRSLPELPKSLQGLEDFTHLSIDQQADFKVLMSQINLSSLQYTYITLGIVFIIITLVMMVIKLPHIKATDIPVDNSNTSDGITASHQSVWSYKHLVLGAVGIFAYVGAEVSIGSFLVNYLGDKNVANLPASSAGFYVMFYWGGAMVGRFISAYFLSKFHPGKILTFNALMSVGLVGLTILLGGHISMYTILAVGFFNSLMFPTIFTLAVKNLGHFTDQGSGILCTAIVGGALVPLLQGLLADEIGIRYAFFIPVLCYLYIAWYGRSSL